MSKEPDQSLNDPSVPSEAQPRQAERDSQLAEIRHADGSTEQVAILSERSWSGALPRPEDFAKYADIVPDAPERILRMAEIEQQHRINMEQQIVPRCIELLAWRALAAWRCPCWCAGTRSCKFTCQRLEEPV